MQSRQSGHSIAPSEFGAPTNVQQEPARFFSTMLARGLRAVTPISAYVLTTTLFPIELLLMLFSSTLSQTSLLQGKNRCLIALGSQIRLNYYSTVQKRRWLMYCEAVLIQPVVPTGSRTDCLRLSVTAS